MGNSPRVIAALLAFIDLSRCDPAVVQSKVAYAAGVSKGTLFLAINRFLARVGRPSDPSASTVEKVRAAFPSGE
jgi:hypothetical protein